VQLGRHEAQAGVGAHELPTDQTMPARKLGEEAGIATVHHDLELRASLAETTRGDREATRQQKMGDNALRGGSAPEPTHRAQSELPGRPDVPRIAAHAFDRTWKPERRAAVETHDALAPQRRPLPARRQHRHGRGRAQPAHLGADEMPFGVAAALGVRGRDDDDLAHRSTD